MSAEKKDQGNMTRRNFLSYLSIALTGLTAAAFSLPVIKYLMPKKTAQFDDRWVEFAPYDKIKEGIPQAFQFSYKRTDGFIEERVTKAHWAYRIPGTKAIKVYSGTCPHLGCAYRYNDKEAHFECPCHLSFFKLGGDVISGPSPRPLDVLPYRIKGDMVEIIDIEFKPGNTERIRAI